MNTTTKLLSLALVLCCLCLGLPNQAAWAVLIQDEPSGFRGNHWGDSSLDGPPLRFVKGLGTTQSGKSVELYDRSTVGIILNGVPFSRIRYRFLDNQLESVQLSYEGLANREKLLQLMEERYGRLTPGERKLVRRAEWDGYETVVDLSYNPETGLGSLWFISTRLNRDFVWPGY
ncbi:MAG: hypothetical protein EPO02_09850 [Nitrospirae bacterium]|nr:MAG: hypothetical protein EPO02_09850 [Nitrospirota bacterium]